MQKQRENSALLEDEREPTAPRESPLDLTDLLGLSSVHVNRSLMDPRRRQLVIWHNHRFEILRLCELLDLARFEPANGN